MEKTWAHDGKIPFGTDIICCDYEKTTGKRIVWLYNEMNGRRYAERKKTDAGGLTECMCISEKKQEKLYRRRMMDL